MDLSYFSKNIISTGETLLGKELEQLLPVISQLDNFKDKKLEVIQNLELLKVELKDIIENGILIRKETVGTYNQIVHSIKIDSKIEPHYFNDTIKIYSINNDYIRVTEDSIIFTDKKVI